jgi:hypothetical protein
MNTVRFSILILASCFLRLASGHAQEIEYSLPQTLPYGTSNGYILGKNSEGILAHLTGRSNDWLLCYSSVTLSLKWKKEITVEEKSATVQSAFLLGDTIGVLYTVNLRGNRILKVNLYSPRFSMLREGQALDTMPSLLMDDSDYRVATSLLGSHALVYRQSGEFNRKKEIRYVAFSNNLQTVRSGSLVLNRYVVPELIRAYVSDNGAVFFLCGDNKSRNYNHLYRYDEVGVFSETRFGSDYNGLVYEKSLIGKPLFKLDNLNNGWVITGLYGNKAGNEATGSFFMRREFSDTTVAQQFMPFTEDFIANIAGQQQTKRARGFYDYEPTDLIVRRDGGAIFVTEAQTQYSENLAAGRFNTMGAGPGMITNHFYFNDLVVFSMDSTGKPEWSQVLRKKQQSDNDEGYYLSYGLLIGPRQLWMVYNDRVGGANNLSGYSVSGTGENKRTVLVDTDRKSLAPIPSQSKQIGPNVLVIPSLRKGQFQLIKITFPS